MNTPAKGRNRSGYRAEMVRKAADLAESISAGNKHWVHMSYDGNAQSLYIVVRPVVHSYQLEPPKPPALTLLHFFGVDCDSKIEREIKQLEKYKND